MGADVAQGLSRGDVLWRRTRWALLLAAILFQGLHQYWFCSLRHGYFNFDKGYQISAARSLLDGYGLSTPLRNDQQPTCPIRDPLMGWPPGYSLLVAGLLAWRDDVWTATLVVDLAATVTFFVAWLGIFERLGAWLSGWMKILVWVVWVLVSNPLMAMTSAEILAQALFSAAIYFAVACAGTRRTGWCAAACGICAGGAAAVRFAYWPLLAAAPIALAAGGLIGGKRAALLKAAAIVAAISFLSLIPLILRQATPCIQGNYTLHVVSRSSGPMLWKQLRFPCAFPASAIGMADAWYTGCQRFPALAAYSEYRAGWLVSLPVLVLAIWPLVRHRRLLADTRTDRPLATIAVFSAAGVVTVLGTVALLVWLSLRVPGMAAPLFPGGVCAFVNEERMFAVFSAFMVIAAASSLTYMLGRARPRWMRTLGFLLLACWMGAGAYTRLWRMGAYLTDSQGWRTSKGMIHRDTRVVWNVVRKHIDAGQTVLFVQREGSPAAVNSSRVAFMADACLIPEEVAARVSADGAARAVLLFMVLPQDLTSRDSPTVRLAKCAHSRPLERLECGTLFEFVAPSEGAKAAASSQRASRHAWPSTARREAEGLSQNRRDANLSS